MNDDTLLSNRSLTVQANTFGLYLIKQRPDTGSVKLYRQFNRASLLTSSPSDLQLIYFVLKHPILLPMVDAYLSFFKPESELRRRIYMMFAILESNPKYHAHFLPSKHIRLFLFVIGLCGLRAILRLAGGVFVVRLLAPRHKS